MTERRRVLYVPNEETLFLNELTDSPRPRPSRLSRTAIFSSESESGPLRPPDAAVDSALLVSYNGYVLADGSGALRPPLTARDATELYKLLRGCCKYLATFLDSRPISPMLTDSASLPSLCGSEYTESSDSDSDLEPCRKRRRLWPRNRRNGSSDKKNYAQLTVLELRELLRERNLPISGTKALLISRLARSDGGALREAEPGVAVADSSLGRAIGDYSHKSFFLDVEAKDEKRSRTVWDTILNMGSRLFRSSNGTFLDENTHLSDKNSHCA